jgi:hypothetical protein
MPARIDPEVAYASATLIRSLVIPSVPGSPVKCDRRGIASVAVRVVTGRQSDAMLGVYRRPRSLFESSAGAYFNDREEGLS